MKQTKLHLEMEERLGGTICTVSFPYYEQGQDMALMRTLLLAHYKFLLSRLPL